MMACNIYEEGVERQGGKGRKGVGKEEEWIRGRKSDPTVFCTELEIPRSRSGGRREEDIEL